MSKQITVTQNDFGMSIETTVVDENKNPIDLTSYAVRVNIIKQDGTSVEGNPIITDAQNGFCEYILTANDTDVEGLCKMYYEINDGNNNITAQNEVYYFVKPKFGGA